MRYVNFLMLLCAGVLFSCRPDPKEILPEFAEIESLMWDHPDSALARLEWMPKPSPSDKLNDATWCLLYTQAWDKNYKKHTSDSLIHVAFRYFDKREDGLRKAQAWFYKGSVLKDLGKLDEATECYVRAKDLTGSFDDPLFASLICQTLGRIYREQDIYEQAFELFREAIHYVMRVPRCDDWSHAYSELGRTFAERKQLDSARYYFECSLENAELIKDLKMQSMAIGELGSVYRIQKDYAKALEYGKKDLALTLEQEDTINYSAVRNSIASIFYRMGELDSAEIYFKGSLNTSNIRRIQTTNLALYYIAKKQHRYDEAFQYIEQYRHYNDSINNVERTRAIAEAQDKYDNEKLENEKKDLLLEKRQWENAFLIGGLVLVSIISLIVFIYQRKLWFKEKVQRISQEKIQEYLSMICENEEKIRKEQMLIDSLVNDLDGKGRLLRLKNSQIDAMNKKADDWEEERQKLILEAHEFENSSISLQGTIDQQKEQIKQLEADTEYLKSQNIQYQNKVEEYIRSLAQNKDEILKTKRMSDQVRSLKSRETFLLDYINKHVILFRNLREKPRQSVDWTLVLDSVDILYNNFYSRLAKDFPNLNEMDFRICCLVKLGLVTSQIAELLCITAPSITKRKYRIREHMNQQQKNLIDPKTTLDMFLITY